MTGEEAFACMTCGLERWLFVCSSGHIDTGAVGANANSGTGVRNGLIVSCTLHDPVGRWHSPAVVFCRLMVPLLARGIHPPELCRQSYTLVLC